MKLYRPKDYAGLTPELFEELPVEVQIVKMMAELNKSLTSVIDHLEMEKFIDALSTQP